MKAKGIIIGICVVDVALIGLSAFLYMNQDRTVPVISFPEETIVYSENMDESVLLSGVTATDDMDGDVSASLLIEKVAETSKGDMIITYAAMDSSNNVAKVSRVLKTNRASVTSRTEPETESEAERESESESESESEQEEEEPEPEGMDEQEPEAGQNEPNGNDRTANNREENNNNQPEENPTNQAPVLRLNSDTLTVNAGTPAVDWEQCIGELSDDKDGRLFLLANLAMEGLVDLNTPGTYPVTIYTRDSDGAESARHIVNVRVE